MRSASVHCHPIKGMWGLIVSVRAPIAVHEISIYIYFLDLTIGRKGEVIKSRRQYC